MTQRVNFPCFKNSIQEATESSWKERTDSTKQTLWPHSVPPPPCKDSLRPSLPCRSRQEGETQVYLWEHGSQIPGWSTDWPVRAATVQSSWCCSCMASASLHSAGSGLALTCSLVCVLVLVASEHLIKAGTVWLRSLHLPCLGVSGPQQSDYTAVSTNPPCTLTEVRPL